ncbi:MAG: hypothetical protein EPO28_13055 [Saprospiraceae bacterium]|nr:MAG: hypothetical protein EPO28_13055 [Saprospiraceae bacterium]
MKPSFRKKIDAIDGSLEELLTLLAAYSHAQLNTKPAPHAWSVMQVMQHLMVAEQASIAYVYKKIKYRENLKKTGISNTLRKVLLWFFLWAPLKFKAPAIVAEDKFPAESDFQDTAESWRRIRADLVQLFECIPPELVHTAIFRHAVAGRLHLDGMLLFFSGHFKRHRKQIERTLRQV